MKPRRKKQWGKPRIDPGYKEWREKVLQRDNYVCKMPGCCKQAREVHHIQRYADNVYLRTQVKNGISLCRQHHFQVRNREADYVQMFMLIVSRC